MKNFIQNTLKYSEYLFIWLIFACIGAVLMSLTGCGIHFTVVEGTWGTTGFAAEVRKNPKTFTAGNAQGADTEYENPFEKNTTYKQIQPVRPLPPSAQ